MTPADFVAEQEGFSATPYADSTGKPTQGFGTTHGITLQSPTVSKFEALAWLMRDLDDCQHSIDALVTVALSDNQNTALLSFVYNLGAEKLRGSTLLQRLNAGAYYLAACEFEKWVHADGKVLEGLRARRLREVNLFCSPSKE